MIRTATIIRHMLDNGPGTIEGVLKKRGLAVRMVDAFSEPLDGIDARDPGLLLVLGGGCGVYQGNLFPFLQVEIDLLKQRLAADQPTLGICLGAQLMAEALGSPVYKGPQGSEIGWRWLQLTEAGQRSPFRHLDGTITPVMQWHGDTFALPDGAVQLALTDHYPQQAFQWGKNGLGVQGHIEVDAATVQSWLVSAADRALDFHRIRTDTRNWTAVMAVQTEKFIIEWLDQLEV